MPTNGAVPSPSAPNSTIGGGWSNTGGAGATTVGTQIRSGGTARPMRPHLKYPYDQFLPVVILRPDQMSEIQTKRPFPDHLYVDVPLITKRISLVAIFVSLLSLIVFLVTGFSAIQPIIAILTIVAAATFYAMAETIKRSYHDRI